MRLLKTAWVGVFVVAGVVVAVLATALTAHVSHWVATDGKHVNIAWAGDGLPPLSPTEQDIAERHRTRDGSRLHHQKGCNCALVFWKAVPDPGMDTRVVDLLAGFNGCTHVTIDCCMSDATGLWMIESGEGENDRGKVDGPQYTAIGRWQGRWRARVPIGGMIDCERLYQDLARQIADPRVRQKSPADWLDFALGRTDPNVVTCSGLIGECILRQPESPLARALRRAMKERITYGELTPNDLARAMAIEDAQRPGAQFWQTPVLNALSNALR